MIKRTYVRCPACGDAVPVRLLWAAGERCPRYSRPPRPRRLSPEPDRLPSTTIALLRTRPAGRARAARSRER